MVRFRGYRRLSVIICLALGMTDAAWAEEAASALYDRPVLVVDPGIHTAPIRRADVDTSGRYAVTGSFDKTVRIWSLANGRPLQTLRVPVGPGVVGRIDAVAISPDGKLIAAGGWTRWTKTDRQDQIYLFDRSTGSLVHRIGGLSNLVLHLTFSPDGSALAATLGGRSGLRVYGRDQGWAEIAADRNYGDSSYGADFAADGRLATTSDDGRIRLYDPSFKLIGKIEAPGGRGPYGIAFSPDGRKLAVCYHESTAVDLLDGDSLAPLGALDSTGLDNGNLLSVAWSQNGSTVYAGGSYDRGGLSPVVAWSGEGLGQRREIGAGDNTIITLLPLTEGRLLVAAQDPYLGLLDAAGKAVWDHGPRKADYRDQDGLLSVSADSLAVDFGYEAWGEIPARFDLQTLALALDPLDDGRTLPPRHDGLDITSWKNSRIPRLDGKPMPLRPYEISRSLAVHPDVDRFVIGTEWHLRAFDAAGQALWLLPAPGAVWAVNISGDGRLVVAAYADGTIRWHRMDDGQELLALFPMADRNNWVAWTPDGFYAATSGAYGVLRWHVNRGWDQAADAIPVSDIAELRRPEVLPLVLQEMDIVQALGLAELAAARRAVQLRTNSAIRPGAQLHVLAIGVGDYNEAARHLRLAYADDDAHDVASALLNTQTSLYARVNPQVLRNEEATKAGIFRALATMEAQMQPGSDDVAVIHFSGHGALLGERLYLLPHEVDARDPVGIEATAIEIGSLRAKIRALAAKGRVLVLLDACRSGAATESGADLTVDARAFRQILAGSNITVLTSSDGSEPSWEHENWQNGAFTEVLLQALERPADRDRNGVISMGELTRHVSQGVPRLVQKIDPERRQTPGIEVRFERTIFAAGL